MDLIVLSSKQKDKKVRDLERKLAKAKEDAEATQREIAKLSSAHMHSETSNMMTTAISSGDLWRGQTNRSTGGVQPKGIRSCVTTDDLQQAEQQNVDIVKNKVVSRRTHQGSTSVLPQGSAPGSRSDQQVTCALDEVEEMVSPNSFTFAKQSACHKPMPINKFVSTAIAAAAQTNNRVTGPYSMSSYHHHQQQQQQQQQSTSRPVKSEFSQTSSGVKPATKSKKQSAKKRRLSEDNGGSDLDSDSDRSDAKGRRKPTKRSKTSSLSSSAKNKDLKEHCRALVAASDRDTDVLLRAIQHLQSRFEEGDDSVNVAQILEWGVHKRLTAMLSMRGKDNLLLKGMIALNNLVARSEPDQFREIIQLEHFYPQLLTLVTYEGHPGVQEQAVWILDNIAIDDRSRVGVVERDGLQAVLDALENSSSRKVTEQCAKVIRTVTGGYRFQLPEQVGLVRSLLGALSMLLYSDEANSSIIPDAVFSLAKLVEREQLSTLQEVFAIPTLPSVLVDLLTVSESKDELHCAAVALTHLASGEQAHIDTLLSLGILQPISLLLDSKHKDVVTGVCGCLSNICAGDTKTLQLVMEAKLFEQLIFLAMRSNNSDAQEFARYAVMFATHGADLKQTQFLVDADVLPVVCGALRDANLEVVSEALKSLEIVCSKFKHRSDFDYVSQMVQSSKGWDAVNYLKHSEDAQVRKLALQCTYEMLLSNYDK